MTSLMNRSLIGKPIEGLESSEIMIPSRSDATSDIRTMVYTGPSDHPINDKLPLMLYIHGGGYIMGDTGTCQRFYKGLYRQACMRDRRAGL